MFRKYGILGMLMIAFAQINFFLKIQPFANWYFPIIWFGYIFLIDSMVYRLRGRSLIYNRPKTFLLMLPVSSLIWWLFEGLGFIIGNWYYSGLGGFSSRFEIIIFGFVAFSTVIPAVFETNDLVRSVHLFDHVYLKSKHRISKNFLRTLIGLGIACLLLTILWPVYFYPLVWVAFFLILDPFNYLHKRPSIISHLKDKNLKIPLSLFLGGTICGFFWEFWNAFAIPRWHYAIPFVDFFRIFEMPVLGYLGYGPFALELYAMFNFFASITKDYKFKYK